jgi:hypothetical protein
MNGFAGLLQQKSRRLAGTGSRGLEMNLSRVNAAHVAGQVVLIADRRRKNGFEVEEKKVSEAIVHNVHNACSCDLARESVLKQWF